MSGCAAEVQSPAAVVITPPTVYLQDVPEPRLQGKTNAHLGEWALALRKALRQSNSDKAALRDWMATFLEPPSEPIPTE